jgi:hypothetical protein
MTTATPAARASTYTRPLDIKRGRVDMSHGAGGKAWRNSSRSCFCPSWTTLSCARATTAHDCPFRRTSPGASW